MGIQQSQPVVVALPPHALQALCKEPSRLSNGTVFFLFLVIPFLCIAVLGKVALG